jgi:hypothetical protein
MHQRNAQEQLIQQQSHNSEDQNPQLQQHKNIITHKQSETAQWLLSVEVHYWIESSVHPHFTLHFIKSHHRRKSLV